MFSQNTRENVSGIIKDTASNPIANVNIILKDSTSGKVVSYTFSKEDGTFGLYLKRGNYVVTFSALGFDTHQLRVLIEDDKKHLRIPAVILKPKIFEIDEVIVRGEKSISIRNDTTLIRTKYFVKGNEENVKDLLQRIPGIEVDERGLIYVQGKKVSKLLIEGDDMLGKGYGVLSRNMPAEPVEAVEIYNNYVENKLLKDIEKTDDIALNLKLKKEYKNVLFGDVEAGAGYKKKYNAGSNLITVGKNKHFLNAQVNNTGDITNNDIEYLMNQLNTSEDPVPWKDINIPRFISAPSYSTVFDPSRTSFNTSASLVYASKFNLSKGWNAKWQSAYRQDNVHFQSAGTTDYLLGGPQRISNRYHREVQSNDKGYIAKIKFWKYFDKRYLISSFSSFKYIDDKGVYDQLFNGNKEGNIIYTKDYEINQTFSLTRRYDNNNVIQSYFHLFLGNNNDNMSIRNHPYTGIFTFSDDSLTVDQSFNLSMRFVGTSLHWKRKISKTSLWENIISNEFSRNQNNTMVSVFDQTGTALIVPGDFANDIDIISDKIYFKSKFRYDNKGLIAYAGGSVNYLYSNLLSNTLITNDWFVNPEFYLSWKKGKNIFLFIFNHGKQPERKYSYFSNYFFTASNRINRGISDLMYTSRTTYLLDFSYGNTLLSPFYVTSQILYSIDNEYPSDKVTISDTYLISDKYIESNGDLIQAKASTGYFIRKLKSNISVKYSFFEKTGVSIKNEKPEEFDQKLHKINCSLRTGFDFFMNIHTGFEWNTGLLYVNGINSLNTNKTLYTDLEFLFNDRTDALLQFNKYHFDNLPEGQREYLFVDFKYNYKLKNNKYNLSIEGKNLLNTQRYRVRYINDISTRVFEYKLLPRMIIFNFKMKF